MVVLFSLPRERMVLSPAIVRLVIWLYYLACLGSGWSYPLPLSGLSNGRILLFTICPNCRFMWLYNISYHWFMPIGVGFSVLISVLSSYILPGRCIINLITNYYGLWVFRDRILEDLSGVVEFISLFYI